jgi:hypothetical protein
VVELRIAGYFDPVMPTIDSFPTFPRRRRSKSVSPTTPTFLSDPEAPVPTKPVVYSPVPTMRTFNGRSPAEEAAVAGRVGIVVILVLRFGQLASRGNQNQPLS